MADWPPDSGARITTLGASAGSSGGIACTASGTANTKGSYAQLVAVQAFTLSQLAVIARFDSAASYLLDIGIGGAGSEVVLVPDIHYSGAAQATAIGLFPLAITQNSRLSARIASSTPSATASVSLQAIAPGFDSPVAKGTITAYGVDSSGSRGTSVDPGGTANTKNTTYTQFTASTTRTHHGIAIGLGNQNKVSPGNTNWRIDIGIGAAGSERVLIANYRASSSTAGLIGPILSLVYPACIPVGSRLAVTAQCDSTDATDRLIDVVLYCTS